MPPRNSVHKRKSLKEDVTLIKKVGWAPKVRIKVFQETDQIRVPVFLKPTPFKSILKRTDIKPKQQQSKRRLSQRNNLNPIASLGG